MTSLVSNNVFRMLFRKLIYDEDAIDNLLKYFRENEGLAWFNEFGKKMIMPIPQTFYRNLDYIKFKKWRNNRINKGCPGAELLAIEDYRVPYCPGDEDDLEKDYYDDRDYELFLDYEMNPYAESCCYLSNIGYACLCDYDDGGAADPLLTAAEYFDMTNLYPTPLGN